MDEQSVQPAKCNRDTSSAAEKVEQPSKTTETHNENAEGNISGTANVSIKTSFRNTRQDRVYSLVAFLAVAVSWFSCKRPVQLLPTPVAEHDEWCVPIVL